MKTKETLKCRKCGGEGKPSKGLMNFHNIQFPYDKSKAEFEDKLLDCIKCTSCGHSWIPEKSTRELALEWWGNLSLKQQSIAIKNSDLIVKETRLISSLTGREIEEIWKKENPIITKGLDLDGNVVIQKHYTNNPKVKGNIQIKPNQKQFKEFSSIHFEKYLDKFNNDNYMAMIGCIAERLNKQEIATCMTGFKNLFEQFE